MTEQPEKTPLQIRPQSPVQSGDDAGGPPVHAGSAASSATIAALLDLVQATYRPDAALSDGERERLQTSIGHMQAASAAMHAYPLTNADEPDPIFAAFRAE